MTDVLFIQGAGQGTHDEWDNKLVASLRRELGAQYEVCYPRMPNEDDPRYATWKPVIEMEIAALRDGAIVVGHSVGGTMLINLLAEWVPPISLGAIALIAAPFVGEGGWPSEEIVARNDFGERLPQGAPVFLYHGDRDDTVPVEHVELYRKVIPHASMQRLVGRGHQLDDDLAEVARDMLTLEAPTK